MVLPLTRLKHLLPFIIIVNLYSSGACYAQGHINDLPNEPVDCQNRMMLKANLSLMLSGEFGLALQVPVNENVAFDIGAGFNMAAQSPALVFLPVTQNHGYTIRGALYYFFDSHHFFGVQGFYRAWTLSNIEYCNQVANNTQISPIGSGFWNEQGAIASGNDYLVNATVNVYDINVIYGAQIPLDKSSHVIIEPYVGLGLRIKTIGITETSQFSTNGKLSALASPVVLPTTNPAYPDVKLGFSLGYKF